MPNTGSATPPLTNGSTPTTGYIEMSNKSLPREVEAKGPRLLKYGVAKSEQCLCPEIGELVRKTLAELTEMMDVRAPD